MTANTVQAAALAAAARGWHVFPVVPGSKRPALRAWEQRATTDASRIEKWFRNLRLNAGIACGPSSLVVIDLDAPDPDQAAIGDRVHGRQSLIRTADLLGQPYPGDTFTVQTPHGWHLYFQAPHGIRLRNTTGRIPRVDSRAWGGYVVAAGSSTPAGDYRVIHRAAVAPLPDWLRDALTPPAPAPAASTVGPVLTTHADAYVAAAVRNETSAVISAVPGTRHDTLLRAAVALGRLAAGGELDPDHARTALLDAAAVHEPHGFTRAEAERTVDDAFRYASKSPRLITRLH